MENENVKQAKNLAVNISKKTWAGTKVASIWTLEKSKEGIAKYKRYAKRKAVKARQEQRRMAEIRETQRLQEIEDNKRRAEEALVIRQQSHDALMEILADDFNAISHDLTPHARDISPAQAEKYLTGLIVPRKEYGMNSKSIASAVGHNSVAGVFRRKNIRKMCHTTRHQIVRTVADLNEKEIGILKLLSFLHIFGIITEVYFNYIKLCIVFNGGSSTLKELPTGSDYVSGQSNGIIQQGLLNWLKDQATPAAIAVNEAIAQIGQARNSIDDPELKAIIDKELKGASGWMNTNRL